MQTQIWPGWPATSLTLCSSYNLYISCWRWQVGDGEVFALYQVAKHHSTQSEDILERGISPLYEAVAKTQPTRGTTQTVKLCKRLEYVTYEYFMFNISWFESCNTVHYNSTIKHKFSQ